MSRTDELGGVLYFQTALLRGLIEQREKRRLRLRGCQRIGWKRGSGHWGLGRRHGLLHVVNLMICLRVRGLRRWKRGWIRKKRRHMLRLVPPESLWIRLCMLPLLSRRRRAGINKGSYPVEDSPISTSDKDCSDVRVHEIASLL